MSNGWAELSEELLLMALERVGWEERESAAVRLTSSRWRRIHDEGRKTLELRDRATDEAVVAVWTHAGADEAGPGGVKQRDGRGAAGGG